MRQTRNGYWNIIFPGSILLIVSFLAGSGCTSLHLYDQASLDLATKTQNAFTNADLSSGLAAERKLMNTIAAREQDVARRQALATRNAAILQVVGQTNAANSWEVLGDA